MHRLLHTLSKIGKDFGLSTAPVAYQTLVLIPHFIAIGGRLRRAFSILYTLLKL